MEVRFRGSGYKTPGTIPGTLQVPREQPALPASESSVAEEHMWFCGVQLVSHHPAHVCTKRMNTRLIG